MISFPRAKDSTSYPVVFHLVLSVDHTSDATGKTPTVTRSKNGGAFNAATGAVTEIGSGWYSWAGNATDRDTLGPLAVHVTATGCDALDFLIPIVTVDPFAANWGIAAVTLAADQAVNVTKWNGSSVAAPNVAGVPKVDVVDWLGSAPNALQAGRVDSYLGAIASGVIAAASFAAGALDGVWSTGTRTLTSFGTLVADIWSNATRTLSAFAFNVTVGDVLAAALAKFFTQDSGSTYAASVSGSVVKEIASNATTDPTSIAAAVWDRLTSALTTVGSIGKLIVDRLDVAVSTRAAAGVSVTVTSPVTQTGDVTIEQGDDYDPADGGGHTLSWTITDGPDLTGGTVVFKTRRFTKACSVVGDVVTLTLTAVETAALTPGQQRYEVEATLADGHIWSLARGNVSVISQIEGV